jgi:hypothetical protein
VIWDSFFFFAVAMRKRETKSENVKSQLTLG